MRKNTSEHGVSGFSVLELLIVIGIVLVVAAMTMVQIQPTLQAARVNNAQTLVLAQLRTARERAIDRRQVERITFTAPQAILIEERVPGAGGNVWNQVLTISLPNDLQFLTINGIPATPATVPDGFGAGNLAIDFAGGTALYFQPDGSSQDVNGVTLSGVVYIARPGELSSSRALTVIGSTGRIRAYRLVTVAGNPTWQ